MRTNNSGLPAFKTRSTVRTPLRDGFNCLRDEVEQAARQLGFDPRRKDWRNTVNAESMEYPFTQDGDSCVGLMLKPVYARVRALELIGGLGDLILELEHNLGLCDKQLVELREVLDMSPAKIGCAKYIDKLERKAA